MNFWKKYLERGLEEDGYPWDWTTRGSFGVQPDRQASARLVAKANGIWAGEGLLEAASQLSAELGWGFETSRSPRGGMPLKSGEEVAAWKGDARGILTLERVTLNLASYVSGIATSTGRLVALVKEKKLQKEPRVTSTRKTLPGYRDLAIQGVLAGGGYSHRVSLSGGVLIKENHIAVAGGITRAVEQTRASAPHGLLIECEVRNQGELDEALRAGAHGVLLDNFSPEDVKKALALIQKADRRVCVEVSGGIDEKNISSYAIEGVDIISSGALTHTVKGLDLSLLVDLR